jgi:hypothetical protein
MFAESFCTFEAHVIKYKGNLTERYFPECKRLEVSEQVYILLFHQVVLQCYGTKKHSIH